MNPNSNKDFLFHISPSSVVKTILIIALFYVLYLLLDLVLLVLTAVLIASAIEPLAKWLTRRKVPRTVAVLSIYLAVAVSLAGIFYLLLVPLIGDLTQFLRNLPQYLQELEEWSPFDIEILSGGLGEGLSVQELISRANQVFAGATGGVFSFLSAIFGGITSFVVVLVLSFYLSLQENGVARFLMAVTPSKYEYYVLDLWKRSEKKIGYWAQGQLLLVLIIGSIVYLGLLALGIPHALLLAVIAGLFELIPLFGPILAAVPAILIAFAQEGWVLALLVVGLYVIVQQLENHAIYPILVKKMVGIPTITVIIALIAGYHLAGFLGVLLSAPIAAVLMELFKDYEKRKIPETSSSEIS